MSGHERGSRRVLGNNEFIPFGAQYYRAPTPPRSEWARDLRNFKEQGFNTIKIWAQWRWNNPAEGVYDFDDLDELMDLADRNGLKVIINTIFDVAPTWLFRKFPDCTMETEDGRKVIPRVTAWRQVGGAPGPCFHHKGAMDALGEFLAATVRQYADHPALYLWDLWNEPELTCGILREPKVENIVCYCTSSSKEFIQWLKGKYLGIEKLNAIWNRNYQSWDDVEVPHSGATFMDMLDWRTFFIHTVTEQMRFRESIARQYDKVHPVMCHTVPLPCFNAVTCACDDWELAETGDLFGNSAGTDPFSSDIAVSAAKDKDVLCAEIHAIPGSTLSRPKPLDFNEMKKFILIPLARGCKGFVYWQYRAELLGREGPAWGLTFPDGSATPWLEHAKRINSALQLDAPFINTCKTEPPEVGVLFSPKNQIFLWCASGSLDFHDQSLIGAHRALFAENYNVGIVHPKDIIEGRLDNYKVIYAPFVYYLEKHVAEQLQTWVYEGGTLIAEPFFAGVDSKTGLHQQVVPGYGLSEMFGAHEGITYPLSERLNIYESDTAVDMKRYGAVIHAALNVGETTNELKGAGLLDQVELRITDATIIGRFENSQPAITKKRYGKGNAILIGSFLAMNYFRTGDGDTSNLIAGLVKSVGCRPQVEVEMSGKVRVDVLAGDGGKLLIVDNMKDLAAPVDIYLKDPNIGSVIDLYGEVDVVTERVGEKTKVSFSIGPSQIIALKATV